MDASAVAPVLRLAGVVSDPRRHNRLHPLPQMIVMAVAAVLCGSDGWDDVADFREARDEWFAQFLDLPQGSGAGHPRALVDREQPAPRAGRELQRRPEPGPQGPRPGEPLTTAAADREPAATEPDQAGHQGPTQAVRLVGPVPLPDPVRRPDCRKGTLHSTVARELHAKALG